MHHKVRASIMYKRPFNFIFRFFQNSTHNLYGSTRRTGFIVAGLDYFQGDPIYLHHDDEKWDRDAWFKRHRTEAFQIEAEWFAGIKERFGMHLLYL